MATSETVLNTVRDQYGKVARGEVQGCAPNCCGPNPISSEQLGYDAADLAALPEGADLGLGCGNPTAMAGLQPGQTVLDLGSGAGIDCLLASKQVGADGQVIGVDMTPDMVSRARQNVASHVASGNPDNVSIRLGEIAHLPVADDTVDVILSNCVVNLAPDKNAVLAEAFRVLKPGGRLAISDIVAFQPLPDAIAQDMAALVGCVAGAATIGELEAGLNAAGFADVAVTPKSGAAEMIACLSADAGGPEGLEKLITSAEITAVKPGGECCAPSCC